MSKINKEYVAQRLAGQLDYLTVAQARRVTNAVFEIITESLSIRHVVEVRGFGTFRVKDFGPRKRVDPHTKVKSDVPARSIVRFRPGSHLRSMKKTEGA